MGKKNRNKINREECIVLRDMKEITAKIAKTILRYGYPESKNVNQAKEISDICQNCINCAGDQSHERNMVAINQYSKNGGLTANLT